MKSKRDIRTALRGSMTALVTPFRDGAIDWPAVDHLIDRQIDGGTDWLVPCGTTGESPTLSSHEHDQLLERVIDRASGRCYVLAGTGSNDTADTLQKTKQAAKAGVDAAMLVAPYYNRPSQEGLYQHFAAVAEAVDLPIVLYNVPARTGVTIHNDTIVRLRENCPNIIAIKDATGGVDSITDLLSRCDIAVLSGDDVLTWPMMALGAVGVISVVSNLTPSLVKSLVKAAFSGEVRQALSIHRKVFDLANGLSGFGPNPLPIKTAMAIQCLLLEEFRLPLCPLPPAAREGIERLLGCHDMLDRVTA